MAKTQHTDLVTDLVEMAASVVEELHEEMSAWQSSLEGANMDHLPKYEQVTECATSLEDADLRNRSDELQVVLTAVGRATSGARLPVLDLDSLSAVYVVSSKKRKSRSDRLGAAQQYLAAACDALEDRLATLKSEDEARLVVELETTGADGEEDQRLDDVENAISELREALDQLENVEFPGMFG